MPSSASGEGRRRRPVRLLEGDEDLFTVDVDVARRPDADPDLIASDLEDGHDDVVSDHDALVGVTREHEHAGRSFRGRPRRQSRGSATSSLVFVLSQPSRPQATARDNAS